MAEPIAELVGRLAFDVDDNGLRDFEEGLNDAEQGADRLSTRAVALGNIIANLASKIAQATVDLGKFIGRTSFEFTEGVIESGVEVNRWAQALGVSVEELQRLEVAGRSVGAETDNVREAVKTLRENLGELARVGTGPALDSLGSLGIELEEIQDLGATEQVELFAEALSEIPDQQKRISIALEVLGEDGAALLPLFNMGAEGVRALTERADELGVVLSQETVDQTLQTSRTIRDLRQTAEGLGTQIVSQLLPIISDVAARLEAWIEQNRELIQQNVVGFVEGVVEIVPKMVDGFETVVDVGGRVIDVISEFDTGSVALAASLGALALVLGGLPGLVVAVGTSLGFVLGEITGINDEIERSRRNAQQFERSAARGRESIGAIEELSGLLDDPDRLVNLSAEELGQIGDRAIRGAGGNLAETEAFVNRVESRRETLVAQREDRQLQQRIESAALVDEDVIALSERQRAARRRARRRRRFESEARAAAEGRGGGIDTRVAQERFGEQIANLATAVGVGDAGVRAAIQASARALQGGATDRVALQAGIGQLERLSDTQLAAAGSADAALFQTLTEIGGPSAARSATEGARFVNIDQSINVDVGGVSLALPEGSAEALSAPGFAESVEAELQRGLVERIFQPLVERFSGQAEP